MSFISLIDIANKNRSPRIGAPTENNITVSIHKGARHNNRAQINFSVSRDLCQKARILPGDRMEVLFNPSTRAGLIRRIQSGGVAASVAGVKVSQLKKGEFYRVNIKLTHYEGMPVVTEPGSCTDISISSEGIEFTFPNSVMFP